MASSKLATFFSTSPLPCDSLQYYCRSAQSAFASHSFRDAELNLTNAISDLTLKCLTTMLINRAVTHGIQGKLHEGLQDAYKVIDLDPKLVEGYLCAGELLKSMGKWTNALHLYDTATSQLKGNDLVRDARIELQKEINDVNTVMFSRLPLEIFGAIVGALKYQDRLQCAATCHAWRAYLLNGLSSMWHELEFVRDTPMDALKFQLRNVNPCQVRSVTLGKSCEPPMVRRILQFLTRCYTIEKLEIQVQVDSSKDTIDLLRRALESNKHSIKKIFICSCLPWVAMTVFDTCPSLADFTFDSTDFYSATPVVRVVQPAYSPVHRPKSSITRLEFIGTLLDYFHESFWQQFPCIEHLIIRLTFITPTVFNALLKSLHLYCPKLKALKMGLFNRSNDVPITTIPGHSGPGLVELNLLSHSADMRGEHDSLAQLIRKSRSTLQTLHTSPRTLGDSTSPAIQELYLLSHLRDLGLHGAKFTDISALGIDLGIIVKNCTRLESLVLNNISINDADFAALAAHAKHLRRFHLIMPHESNVAHQAMNDFLQTHNLVDVYFQGQRVLNDQGLEIFAAKHSRLESFELLGCLTVTEDGLVKFAQRCSTLRRMMLYHVPVIEAQQCIDRAVALSMNLEEFYWVGHPSDARDREQIVASLEGIARRRAGCNLKVRILFGTQEKLIFRCLPGHSIIEEKEDIAMTKMLRYT